ncbi:glycosyltransferase family 4 protein [Streptacidiphilus sp. EB103A]|uniref:glycosyltransferase family 4 protein n=1 Tax=Streptacidiphilus sp. EB103A TaxID=3156275 RepID=UPI00351350D4
MTSLGGSRQQPGMVHFVVPASVEDPTNPSGGNVYDTTMARHLPQYGWDVRMHPVPGGWPLPSEADRGRLAELLQNLPTGSVVLIDGLVGCCVPEIIDTAAQRLTMVALVHMPLADEVGLDRVLAVDLQEAERTMLRRCAGTVTTSHHIRHRICSTYNLTYQATTAAPPGTDRAPLATGSPGASRLLCVAAITPTKNQMLLVQALEPLAHLPWTLRLVGPERAPDYVAAVRDTATKAGLAERITVTGPLAGEALAAEYANADLALLPSVAETYGMVIGEALAAGLPVAATCTGGTYEALYSTSLGPPGRLLDPHDPAAWTEVLQQWLTDPALRDELRAAAEERRSTLPGWDATASTVARALDRACTPVTVYSLEDRTALAGTAATALRTLDPGDTIARITLAESLRGADIVPDLAYDRIPRSTAAPGGLSRPAAPDPQGHLEYVLARLLQRLEAIPGYGDDLLSSYADDLDQFTGRQP